MAFIVNIFIAIILANAFNSTLMQQIMGYNKSVDTRNAYHSQLVSFYENSKLYTYEDEKRTNDETYFKKYMNESLLGDKYVENPIYYYYADYIKESTISQVNTDVLKFTSTNLENDFYITTSLDQQAKLKDDVSIAMSNYLMGYATSGEYTIYQNFETYFMGIISNAREQLSQRSEVSAIINKYKLSSEDCARKTSNSGLVSYVISTMFVFWIVPMVFGKKTFGDMIFRINVVFQDNEKITHFDMLSRYIMMIPLIFFGSGFTSFADYLASSILLPFIGNVTYVVPCFISLVLCLIEMVVIIKSKTHQGYYDRALYQAVVSYNPNQIGLDDQKGE